MIVGIDSETRLIRPGLGAPPPVCFTWSSGPENSRLWHVNFCNLERKLKRVLESGDAIHGVHIAYDWAVAMAAFERLKELIFRAYFENRIHDCSIDQRMIDNAVGQLDGHPVVNDAYDPSQPKRGKNKPFRWLHHKYGLQPLVQRLLGRYVPKGADTWRLRYQELEDVRPELWPEDAVRYAISDAVEPVLIHAKQLLLEPPRGYTIPDCLADSGPQAEQAFALYLMTCRGIRTDRRLCLKLIEATKVEIKRCREIIRDNGLLIKGVKNQAASRDYMLGALLEGAGLENTTKLKRRLLRLVHESDDTQSSDKRTVTVDLEDTEIAVKLTKTGEICLDADACKSTHDPVLRALSTYTSASSLKKKAELMLLGASLPLQTKFNTPMATARTSSSKQSGNALIGDNFQNFRRNAMANEAGDLLPGQRECVIARPGFVLGSLDFAAVEMRCKAQLAIWQLGWSDLAESLNAGKNPHVDLAAAHLLDSPISYEQAAKLKKLGDEVFTNAAQFAKVPNFALLGGAFWRVLILYAKGMGITLTDERAKQLYAAFHAKWREVAPMNEAVRHRLQQEGGSYTYESVAGFLIHVDRLTKGCNYQFQNLAAHAAKSGLAWIAAEMYTGKLYTKDRRATSKRSVLHGAYPLLFAHDEVVSEFVEHRAAEQAARQAEIMEIAGTEFCPDVALRVEVCLMRNYDKSAKAVYDKNGQLTVYEGKNHEH